MTFAGASVGLFGTALAVGGAAIVTLYLLKLKRRRFEVPFVALWDRVLGASEARSLWRKLRRLLSLLIQLAIFAMVVVSLGDPRLRAGADGRTVALVVDQSASMQAEDGAALPGEVAATVSAKRTRLEEAKRAAAELVRGLGDDDEAIVIGLDARPTPRTGLGADARELLSAIDALETVDAPADLDGAMRAAADALRGRSNPTIVLISDGGYDDAALARAIAPAMKGADVRYRPVGGARPVENAAITAFAVRRYRANQTAYEVLVEARSFAQKPIAARLELVQEGEVVEVERLTLAPGQTVTRRYPNLAGEGTRLEARLVADAPAGAKAALDALPVDDRAYAVLPPRKKLRVLLVTKGNLFLEGALLLDENLAVDKVAPGGYDAALAAKHDAVVLDGFVPPAAPPVHALYVDPRGDGSPFPLRGEIKDPLVTELAAEHPLARWLALKDLNITRASRFQLGPGDVAVASSLRQPIIAARDRDGRKVVALGFDLRQSDLPLRVAFPILLVNTLEWFAGSDGGLVASFPTGRPIRLMAPAGATELAVRDAAGVTVRAPVIEGRAPYLAERAGFLDVSATGARTGGGNAPSLVAANLTSPDEARALLRPTLVVDGKTLAAPERGALGVPRALWPLLIFAALALLLVEWWTYNRRVTV